jgi:hypothetical protein
LSQGIGNLSENIITDNRFKKYIGEYQIQPNPDLPSGFKTKFKNQNQTNLKILDVPTNSFNLKVNKKKFSKHLIGARYMFNVDFFFTGKPQGGFVYLLAININNRKCWAIPVNVEINEAESIATIVKSGRSTESYLKAMRSLISQTKVRFIRADKSDHSRIR